MIKFAVPVWVLLAVLEPIESTQDIDDDDTTESYAVSCEGRMAEFTPNFFPCELECHVLLWWVNLAGVTVLGMRAVWGHPC